MSYVYVPLQGNVLTPDEVLFTRSDSVLARLPELADDVKAAYTSAFLNSSRLDKSFNSSVTMSTIT